MFLVGQPADSGFNKQDNSMCNSNVKVSGVEIVFA